MSTPIRASDAFREESDTIWTVLHRHPFITELAEGTFAPRQVPLLPRAGRLLISRSTGGAWRWERAKSRNERELRYFTVDLNQVLDAEIPNNRELLAQVIELGAEDRGGSLTMAPANVAYTSYLQALALRNGPLDIMAALLPCSWSYVEIATALRERVDIRKSHLTRRSREVADPSCLGECLPSLRVWSTLIYGFEYW
jgi:thiaminase (transcriptional activator TenA)